MKKKKLSSVNGIISILITRRQTYALRTYFYIHDMSRTQKRCLRVLGVILIKTFIFLFPGMCIISRLICEILSRKADDLRFLWDSLHGIHGAVSFVIIVTS